MNSYYIHAQKNQKVKNVCAYHSINAATNDKHSCKKKHLIGFYTTLIRAHTLFMARHLTCCLLAVAHYPASASMLKKKKN